jgi:hypothetical protein
MVFLFHDKSRVSNIKVWLVWLLFFFFLEKMNQSLWRQTFLCHLKCVLRQQSAVMKMELALISCEYIKYQGKSWTIEVAITKWTSFLLTFKCCCCSSRLSIHTHISICLCVSHFEWPKQKRKPERYRSVIRLPLVYIYVDIRYDDDGIKIAMLYTDVEKAFYSETKKSYRELIYFLLLLTSSSYLVAAPLYPIYWPASWKMWRHFDAIGAGAFNMTDVTRDEK